MVRDISRLTRRHVYFVGAGLAIAVLGAVGSAWVMRSRGPDVDALDGLPMNRETGRVLYAQHCASCHGLKLEGQADWGRRLPSGRLPAPPHDASGHTWHHPDEVLLRITKEGPAAVVGNAYESDMPGFAAVLTDQQIRDVIGYIKSTWPERERTYQDQINRAASAAK